MPKLDFFMCNHLRNHWGRGGGESLLPGSRPVRADFVSKSGLSVLGLLILYLYLSTEELKKKLVKIGTRDHFS